MTSTPEPITVTIDRSRWTTGFADCGLSTDRGRNALGWILHAALGLPDSLLSEHCCLDDMRLNQPQWTWLRRRGLANSANRLTPTLQLFNLVNLHIAEPSYSRESQLRFLALDFGIVLNFTDGDPT